MGGAQGLNRLGGSCAIRAWRAPVETNPTRACELLVGLPDVNVLGVGWSSRSTTVATCLGAATGIEALAG